MSQSSTQPTPEKSSFRYRPLLILLFAIILLVANRAKAVEPSHHNHATIQSATHTVIQLNDTLRVVPKATVVPAAMLGGATVENHYQPHANQFTGTRPKYAELHATLANFDADADPDGWRAKVVLRDAHDRPVIMRARATFSLTPRLPTADFHSYVDTDTKPITWSKDVRFDADGVANFKLPLTQRLQPPALATRHGSLSNPHGTVGQRIRTTTRLTAFSDLINRQGREHLGLANFGELKVRLSVPTEGVFEAASPVQLRPSVLVDTRWPYR